MKFIQEGSDKAVNAIVKQLVGELKSKKPVIWLVSGGSNITNEVAIMQQLRKKADAHLGSLLILPMDERYGAAGHPDSNTAQMKTAGFDPGDAMWIDVLVNNLPLQETVDYYSGLVQNAFPAAESIVSLFGIGTDAHVAGVLPGSPAVYEEVATVVGYDSAPYIRLTLSPTELVKTTTAYLLAYGENKLEPLTRLRDNKEPIEKVPAKMLHDIPEVFVYNDQIAGDV